MSQTQARFCKRCGTPFTGVEAFCTTCGTPRPVVGSNPAPAAPPPPPPQPARAASTPPPPPGRGIVANTGAVVAGASTAGSTVARVAGVAGMGIALPWQTITGSQVPDVRAFLAAAAAPAAQRVVRASLKRPGIALAVTTVLDLFIAGVTGGLGGIMAALPRSILAGASSGLSLITGSKGGGLRTATGVLSLLTAVVQLGSAGWALVGGLLGGASMLSLLPGIVAMLSSLVMAVKTAIVALKKQP